MSRFRQFFKTSESDKDDCLIIPKERLLNEILKNRKCSTAATTTTKPSTPATIKDKKKHHLKETKNESAKNKPINPHCQSSFYVLISGENVDQENNINVIIDQCLNDKKSKMLKSSNQNERKNRESKKEPNKEKHIYQNESIVRIQTTGDIKFENQDYKFDNQQQKQKQKTAHLISNQQIEKPKTAAVTTPLKMIKKRLKKPKEIIFNNQVNNKNECTKNEIQNQSRRRKENQSFDDLNDRLDFIRLTSATGHLNKSKMNGEEEENYRYNKSSFKPNYKSEDNLLSASLSIVPNVPRSMSKLNNNNFDNDTQIDRNHHLQSTNLQFYSKNPVYRSFEHVRDKMLHKIESQRSHHQYVNDLSIDELISRPKKSDLISLRELKPKQFLIPDIQVTSTEEENEKKLTYVNVNLIFDKNSKRTQQLKEFNKSDDNDEVKDEEKSKIEYCKIDFVATESLIQIREHRIATDHL